MESQTPGLAIEGWFQIEIYFLVLVQIFELRMKAAGEIKGFPLYQNLVMFSPHS